MVSLHFISSTILFGLLLVITSHTVSGSSMKVVVKKCCKHGEVLDEWHHCVNARPNHEIFIKAVLKIAGNEDKHRTIEIEIQDSPWKVGIWTDCWPASGQSLSLIHI